ncbi:uncharacterized protein A4U43_C06F9660 [Asparagus officinalis]|uniref:Uncharacterized protein n=1 Tax=Asparagus officinalis TaxID=4686 RepID=A0A5P1EPU1_ASPOF|nr:uncharacterized protein A4U43_C06F9660 [Asparagus officinalis]
MGLAVAGVGKRARGGVGARRGFVGDGGQAGAAGGQAGPGGWASEREMEEREGLLRGIERRAMGSSGLQGGGERRAEEAAVVDGVWTGGCSWGGGGSQRGSKWHGGRLGDGLAAEMKGKEWAVDSGTAE